MPFIPTTFPGMIIFEPAVFEDSRGHFYESYNERLFHENGINIRFVQDNQSRSSYGVIRGLHYQRPPYAQTKLIRVLSGAVIDAVVDLRTGSPTFGQSFSLELSAGNKKQLLVPKGFAHGFSVISETAEVLYKCDAYYSRESERGIIYNDTVLNIDWQIPANKAVVSEKDKLLPLFNDYAGEFLFIS
ncbi:MAG: dTDP-4-dehydrorhamnose 3,5-epimerase [Chitinophagaceae bacterium]|nr:dTDP-4-dehydrorhamnose 3,5-epimerase [Chitinophagaceae bacterium]